MQASQSQSRLEKGCLVYVQYRDHVLFRNTSPNRLQPIMREAVGWITKLSPEYVIIVSERSKDAAAESKPDPGSSGLLILKSEILKARGLEDE